MGSPTLVPTSPHPLHTTREPQASPLYGAQPFLYPPLPRLTPPPQNTTHKTRTCIHCPDFCHQVGFQQLFHVDGVGVVEVLTGHCTLRDGVTCCQHCQAVEATGDAVGPLLDLLAGRIWLGRDWPGDAQVQGRQGRIQGFAACSRACCNTVPFWCLLSSWCDGRRKTRKPAHLTPFPHRLTW